MGKYSPKKRTDKSKQLIVILLLITFLAICITVWALFFRGPQIILAPDFVPQETEEYAEIIPDDTDDSVKSEEGGGSVVLEFANEVTIDLSDKNAVLSFANPGRSNQNMVLQVVIQDEVIIQSNTLSPGYEVSQLKLLPNADSKLRPGIYQGKFLVLYYDLESGEKSLVNTEIPLQITVVK